MTDQVGCPLVISPHCDDAVLSCGRFLAAHPGSTVVTVFAGRPPAGTPLPEWDAAAGFRPGDDVMGIRREEDRAALTFLDAHPWWLDFCDSQYHCSPAVTHITAAFLEIMTQIVPYTVLFPLGLFHSDHLLVHEAALPLLARYPTCLWVAYEDALYRHIPGLVEEKIQHCIRAGLRPQRIALPSSGNEEQKRRAVFCYQSQLRALTTPGRPGYAAAFAPERFWRFTPV